MRKPKNVRPAAFEDLAIQDQEIYNALPEDLRQRFLSRVPPIKINTVARDRLLNSLTRHLDNTTILVDELSRHKRDVERAVKDLRSGVSPGRFSDLAKLPAIPGFSIRRTRARRRRANNQTKAEQAA